VLGLASDEERREFEQMCLQYPEVLEARSAFELSLEKQAMENAIAPPADLKNKILSEFGSTGKVVAMQSSSANSMNWIKYAAAACFVLLAGSVYYNISLSNKNKKLQGNYDSAVAKLNDMENDMAVMIGRQSIKMTSLKGTDISPQSYTTVYWDTTSHDVYLLVNNLPAPASDKQYQLWAFINGQPVDLGYFDIKKERLLIQAKNAQGVEAFAITLEKKGRPDPSKPEGALYVVGKL
jgi:anti-sigma-K factor RskA